MRAKRREMIAYPQSLGVFEAAFPPSLTGADSVDKDEDDEVEAELEAGGIRGCSGGTSAGKATEVCSSVEGLLGFW